MGRMCEALFNLNQITFEEARILRIAALLHDVGHFPFSHLTETVYSFIELPKPNEFFSASGQEENGSEIILRDLANTEVIKTVNHEILGAYVICADPEIKGILEEENLDPELIGHIITGEIGIYNNSIVYEQLMHSKLDADRLDYLLRDSCKQGLYLVKWILTTSLGICELYHLKFKAKKPVSKMK